MSKLSVRPLSAVAWSGMTALAVVEPALACLAVLKLAQASTPGASERQLLLALLYALPVVLFSPARRALGRLVPANANRRPMLLVWAAGLSSTVIIWHAAAVTHGSNQAFQLLATVQLSFAATYSYAQLGRRTILHRVQGRHIAAAVACPLALLALRTGGAFDHQANVLGIILGVAIPAAATLWRCLVRDFTTPSHTLVATYR